MWRIMSTYFERLDCLDDQNTYILLYMEIDKRFKNCIYLQQSWNFGRQKKFVISKIATRKIKFHIAAIYLLLKQ